YKWKIKNKYFVCESQLVPVSVFVRDIVDNKEVVESNSDKCLIFPNPTHNELQILLFDDAKIMKISIMNAQGQLLESFDNFKNRIDVNNYTSGLYQIEIKTDQYTSVKKWIKL
nr:T9SS type A sorting domain-containing protein [Saprospiraceae bacterium]